MNRNEFLYTIDNYKENFDKVDLKKLIEVMANNHKYNFNSQLNIYYTRPEVTALATYNQWKEIFNRQVKRNSKGVNIIVDNTIRTVFDIKDTFKIDKNIITTEKPDLSNINLDELFARILINKVDISDYNKEIKDNKIKLESYVESTINSIENSEKLDDIFKNDYINCRNAMDTLIMYGINSRLGNSIDISEDEVNRSIETLKPYFNKVSNVNYLGFIISATIKSSINEITKTKVEIEKENNYELETLLTKNNIINTKLDLVKQEIVDFCNKEYDENITNFDEEFKDLEHIELAYTETEDAQHSIQFEINLKDISARTLVDNVEISYYNYKENTTIEEALDKLLFDLQNTDFNTLVSVDEKKLYEKLNLKIDENGNFYKANEENQKENIELEIGETQETSNTQETYETMDISDTYDISNTQETQKNTLSKFQEIRNRMKLIMNSNYPEYIMSIIGIENNINNEAVLREIYERYMSDDTQILLSDELVEYINEKLSNISNTYDTSNTYETQKTIGKLSYEEVRKEFENISSHNYSEYIKSIIGIENNITDENILENIYNFYMDNVITLIDEYFSQEINSVLSKDKIKEEEKQEEVNKEDKEESRDISKTHKAYKTQETSNTQETYETQETSNTQETYETQEIHSPKGPEEEQNIQDTENNETNTKIEDFGEKIGGARKDLYTKRGLEKQDLDDLSRYEKSLYIKKQYCIPKPNYKELYLNEKRPIEVIYFINELYNRLPTKPHRYQSEEDYVELMTGFKEIINNIKSIDDIKAIPNKLLNKGFIDPKPGGSYTAKFKASRKLLNILSLPIVHSKEGVELILSNDCRKQKYLYDIRNTKELANEIFDAKYKIIPINEKTVERDDMLDKKVYRIRYKEYSRVYLKEKYLTPEVIKNLNDIIENQEKYRNKEILLNLENNSIVEVGKVDKNKILEKIETEIKEEREKASTKENIKEKENKVKIVPPILKNITRKGIQYINNDVEPSLYKNTFNFKGVEFGNWLSQKERQANLNFSFEAFKDLALALGIKDSEVSLGGELSIGFGSRGHSRALAHFEPGYNAINLTKMKGAGSLAHEWCHALDHYLAKNVSDFGNYGFNNFYSNQYLFDTKDVYKNTDIKNKWKTFIKAIKDGRFYEEAKKLDELTGKSNFYWSSEVELVARAGAAIIKDILEEKGYTNDYLCGHADFLYNTLDGETIHTSPQGKEREKLKELFVDFIEELKENKVLQSRENKQIESEKGIEENIEKEENINLDNNVNSVKKTDYEMEM